MIGSFTLMHNDDKVCDIKFNQAGFVEKINKVYDERLLPPAINKEKNMIYSMMEWIGDRVGINERPDIMGVRAFLEPKLFQLAGTISLFDCYWFKNNSKDEWDEINPYDNWDPDTDIVCLLNLKPNYIRRNSVSKTPNFSIPGKNSSFWYKYDGKIVFLSKDIEREFKLYKYNPDNLIVAQRKYMVIEETLFAASLSQQSKDIESMTLSAIYRAYEDPDKGKADNIITICENMGLNKREVISFFEELLLADEKAGIEDRELNTVRLLRDSHTLEMIGFAKL